MEEWAALNFPDKEVFFTWAVQPTVIIGRHQCLEAEVDTAYCRDQGIDIVRRLSGGGCVYADPQNLMVSYVCPSLRPAPDVFAEFVERLAGVLRTLGLKAEVSGRNDITIEGGKVSGCAYYNTGTHAIVHTTMLFGANPVVMTRAITPEKAKLAARGVKSVASRITTISEHNPALTIPRFREALGSLIDEEMTLTAEQEQQIREIEARYRTPEHLHGRRLGADIVKSARIEGVGGVQVQISLSGGIISDIHFEGDFLTGAVPISLLRSVLIGQSMSAIDLRDLDVSTIITGLSNSQLISLIAQQ